MPTHLNKVEILGSSGFCPTMNKDVPALKKDQYHTIVGYSITGDAPKTFIKVYDPKYCKKAFSKTWLLYIAKTGHKWYPGESITEFLLNQLGMVFGLNMAESRIVFAGHQIRFLSKYFLDPKEQELVHGAEIFAGYLEDEDLVQKIEKEQRAREIFTVDFVKKALEKYFGQHAAPIFRSFVEMLLFDAWVGNNDRHFYNWGVIRHLSNAVPPQFSPIYDTARGLFWNEREKKVVFLYNNPKELSKFLEKYLKNSKPKTGIDGDPSINHFQLLQHIYTHEIGITKQEFGRYFTVEKMKAFSDLIDGQFKRLLTKERRGLIIALLKARLVGIQRIYG